MKVSIYATLIVVFAAHLPAATITLSGQIRDFCAPSITASCTTFDDFEGIITGVITGSVSSTLNASGLPNFTGGFSSATNTANFAKWFTDTPGFNTSAPFTLTLSETQPGSQVYTYSNNAFFPLDGSMLGNQGRPHNYHFTLRLSGLTDFKASDTFNFAADDDLWVYVGGKLAVDLGGVHGAATRTITGADLMLLGLMENTVYSFDVFFAERHTIDSAFVITASSRFSSVPEPSTWVSIFCGLGAIALGRRKASHLPAAPTSAWLER